MLTKPDRQPVYALPEAGTRRPFVVGIGGTTRAGSSSETALRTALAAAAGEGAATRIFAGADLDFPMYAPERPERSPAARAFTDAIRQADAVIIASPGYHGSVSGLIKNALDYLEDLRGDPRPYLDGRAVGCIACAYGWQAGGSTLSALRSIVHALRGWPTPFGAAINSAAPVFENGACVDQDVLAQLTLVGRQAVQFVRASA